SSRTERAQATAAALVDVTMPQMGVSVAEGTVVEWRVNVGDPVVADEPVCDISSDKIDSEVPAPASGVLHEIRVPVGETVEVGTPLARIATDGAAATADAPGPAPDATPAGDGAASATAPTAPRPAAPAGGEPAR